MLGMNLSGSATCQGEIGVKVRVVPAGSSAASTTATDASDSQQKPRGEQLKSQLSTAAQVFMSGQFGLGKSDNGGSETGGSSATSSAGAETSNAIAPLQVSDAALDPQLRTSIDSLPRRINDQFQNLGDMVNFVIVGSEKDVQAALDAATWHVADTDNKKAALNAFLETYDNKDYLAMPMSTLYLFGRKQDFGYEMAEPIAMVASRHHFRIWKAPFIWNGHEVWVGAGTHDIGFAKDKRNGSVTHKIDPAVDGERDNIGSSLQRANKTKTLTYYLPPDPVQDAKNATGDGYHSDGKLLVIFLQ
jgi:LssY C-terminus